jgi:hypothetical protein
MPMKRLPQRQEGRHYLRNMTGIMALVPGGDLTMVIVLRLLQADSEPASELPLGVTRY